MFYARLFEIAPAVKPLFHGDMTEQGRKLMMTLGVVVNGLRISTRSCPPRRRSPSSTSATASRRPITLRSARRCCGRCSRGSAEAYTAEVDAAWTTAYTTLSGVMIAAAYGEEAAA